MAALPIGETSSASAKPGDGHGRVTAALANAVYHATGAHVHDLPITLDNVLQLSA